MRADRLLSILMLLQKHKRMSARQLARELEVSPRTIFRDMNALSGAGVPVYMERGVNGGCCLVEDYHTELTGLTAEEAQALLLLSLPGPLDVLDVGVNLRAALRKLEASLPAYLNALPSHEQEIYMDWEGKQPVSVSSDVLNLLHRALREGKMVSFDYSYMGFATITVNAGVLGLVTFGEEWYVVYEANGKINARPVASLVNPVLTEKNYSRPDAFDLAACWQNLKKTIFSGGYEIVVDAWVHKRVFHRLQSRMKPVEPAEEMAGREGWRRCRLSFMGMDAVRRELLPLGSAVEVLAPEEARLTLLDFASQIVEMYQPDRKT